MTDFQISTELVLTGPKYLDLVSKMRAHCISTMVVNCNKIMADTIEVNVKEKFAE